MKTGDDWRYTKMIIVALMVGIALICLASFWSHTDGKELPVLVKIEDLGHEHDGKRVVVFGWCRSTGMMTGRLGSKYIESTLGEGDRSVLVYSAFPNYGLGHRVVVQGVYHQQGRYGGLLVDGPFIVAQAIERDWVR